MKNNLYVLLIFIYLSISGCTDYSYEPPNCVFLDQPTDLIPFGFELESESFISYRFMGNNYKMIFRDLDGYFRSDCIGGSQRTDTVKYLNYGFKVDKLVEVFFFHPFYREVLASQEGLETEIISYSGGNCTDSLRQFRMGINVLNSCGRRFEPLVDGNSFHKIVSVEQVEQYVIETENGNYLHTRFDMYAVFAANYKLLDGSIERMEGEYRYELYSSELME